MNDYQEAVEILEQYGYSINNLSEEKINKYLLEIIKNNQKIIKEMQENL